MRDSKPDLSTFPSLLKPAEVAKIFGVDSKTVVRWAKEERLTSIRTPGGHRRYYADEVREFLALGQSDRIDPELLPGEDE